MVYNKSIVFDGCLTDNQPQGENKSCKILEYKKGIFGPIGFLIPIPKEEGISLII